MKALSLIITLGLLAGCANLGPRAIQGTRTDYNIALRKTDDEQLLLNLVRLRYRDRALFLEVSALNTQFTFVAGAGFEAELGGVDDLYGASGSVAVEESPTVTYTPLQGADFVERLLTPVPLETLFLLDSSGWALDRVFRVLLDQMNDVKNAPGSTGPTPKRVTAFEDFIRLAELFREFELRDYLVGATLDDRLVLRFAEEARSMPEYLELTELLGLDPTLGTYAVTSNVRTPRRNTIDLRFRSFAGVLYFLSQSVAVPEGDVAAGRVTVTLDDANRPFDWGRVTENLMSIRSSAKRPDAAYVSIRYRGSWFYIDDSDLDSKSTFSLLGQIFALQSGNVEGLTPMLTIPVGG